MMEAVTQDLRYGIRNLLRSPGFTFVAVVTLALGIGANTAIFSVVYGVLLRPLPYEDPGELVSLREVENEGGTMAVAWPNYVDWREQSGSFAGLAAYSGFSSTVLGGEEPVTASGALVGEDFWRVFPLSPTRGRLTARDDHRPGAQPVAVVSNSFWQNELAGRPLESYSLEITGQRVQVVGVVPDAFAFPDGTQIWLPVEPTAPSGTRTAHNWSVVGRMAPGVPLERVREEVGAIMSRIIAAETDADPDFLAAGVSVVPLVDEMVGASRRPLYLLLATAGLVLLVACTNLASMWLARGTARRRELAVRASLGATRRRIVGQLLVESLLLAGLGAAAGAALAVGVVHAIRVAGPAFLPRVAEIGVDGAVLAYTAGVALLTAVLFGLLPAKRLSRPDSGDALRTGSRGNAGEARAAIWRVLVGMEVALTLVLLVGSGLLVRSFQSLLAEDAGFDATDVSVITMALPRLSYPQDADHARFYDDFLARLEGLPDVTAAGLLSSLPTSGSLPNGRVELDGDMEKFAVGGYVVASAGAFEALDVPLLRGRLFDQRDRPDAPHVAIVSRGFAERYWPGEDAVGKQVTGGGMDSYYQASRFAEVVGVVDDVRHRDLAREAYPTLYFPYRQRPGRLQYEASVVVESASGAPARLISSLRDALRAAEPDVPVSVATMQSFVGDSLGERRFVMLVLGGFGLTALMLAGVGIFGVVSYSVARRTREIGIRVALGSDRAHAVRAMMSPSMRATAVGLLAGLVGALLAARLLRAFLYEVSPADPLAIAAAVLLLGAAALLASWLPARASARVDPVVSMRVE